ncbi:MAG: AbrB/MazE/SpoVT family DNA-binding domain-containing protein [Candidatus Aenigmarchaeota archaeon]|nr:AbrB/MazE/SpoVT family DNA-binding domain-containing protein [Candidatus Aenigmarchaeota archaeon]
MTSIKFSAEVWKQGNSLLVTIPKAVRDTFGIKEGDAMHVSAMLIDKRRLQMEKEVNELRARYQLEGSGYIVRKNPKTGKDDRLISLDHVFLTKYELRGGFLAEGQSLDDLPLRTSYDGVIFRGRFLSDSFKNEHYTSRGIDKIMGRFLRGDEKMILTLKDGSKLVLTRISFDDHLDSTKNPLIEKKEFRADSENECK